VIPGPALALIAALAASPTQVVVQQGENLAQVAKRSLGDERAATELKALNGLSGNEIQAGTTLRLPGPERARALSAVAAARNAALQARSSAQKQEEVSASLNRAEELIQAARYKEAAAAADNAWRLVSAAAPEGTRFAVEVKPDGHTQVSSQSGQPIRVERDGETRPVLPGQTLSVSKGQALAPAGQSSLAVPALTAPADLARLKFKGAKKAHGPITFSWQVVPGAAQYQLVITPMEKGAEKSHVLSVEKTEARISSLQAGRYTWSVRALGAGGLQSDRSSLRTFELAPDGLKLEIKGTSWK
jgi:LysM repeat protein